MFQTLLILLLALLLVVGVVATFFYLYIRLWTYNHWKRLKISYIKPEFPYGTFKYGGSRHVTQLFQKYHEQFKGQSTPLYGTFTLIVPTLTVTSLDLTKKIFIQNFQNFHDRFKNYVVKHDYLTKNLVRLEGSEWKSLRNRLSPAFTSGQMKHIFPTIVNVAEKAVRLLENLDTKNLEIKDFMERYTTDVIGCCVFGLETNSLENENDFFRANSKLIIQVNRPKSFLLSIFPRLATMFKMTLFDQNACQFYTNVVRETIKHREQEDVKRNDFIDIMIQARKNGEESLSLEEITAQLVLFYTAGSDNTSSTLTFTLFELARNQELQTLARNDVINNIKKYNGLTYEAVNQMKFLKQCVNETLRKYPPSPIITRNTTEDYVMREMGDFIIKKGTRVTIPIYCFHHDPEYFPDPEKYDPSRFADETQPRAYFPFGDGPRSCIAARFGLLNILIGLSVILKNFKVKISEKTQLPLEFNSKVPMLHLKNGLYLKWDKL